MALFNTLLAECPCEHCGRSQSRRIQFKYGDTYQHEYQIGDQIQWSNSEPSNDWGNPAEKKVVVEGVCLECDTCGHKFLAYDIFIEESIIKKALKHSVHYNFTQENIIVLD